MSRAARSPLLGSQAALVLAAGSIVACGANGAQRPDPPPSAVAADAAAVDAALDAGLEDCDVRRAARTFVGFSENMSLDDFELAAFEAERIVRAIRDKLCAPGDAGEIDPSLSAALDLGPIEITSIVFTSDDARAADARLQLAMGEGLDAAPSRSWLLRLVRDADQWQVVSAAAQ